MKVRFNHIQYKLLCAHSLIENTRISRENNTFFLTADKEFFESLLDKLSTILVQDGLTTPNDEPNKLGLEIEGIIDVISRIVYSSR
jgi:hypothetical protein